MQKIKKKDTLKKKNQLHKIVKPHFPDCPPKNFRESVYDIILFMLDNNYFDIKDCCYCYFRQHNISDFHFKAAVRNLIAGVFRNFIFIEYTANNYCKIKPSDYTPDKKALLYSGIYETLFGNEPAYAVVNENVNICKRRTDSKFSGFINAVLKKIAADKNKIFICRARLNPSVKFSIPESLLKNIIQTDFNKRNINTILEAYNNAPHYYLNINSLKINADKAEAMLKSEEINFTKTGKDNAPLKITGLTRNIGALDIIKNGFAYIQDLSSYICASITAAEAEKTRYLVDFCAAPGLKTVSILNMLKDKKKKIMLADIDKQRLKITRSNIENLITKNKTYIIQANALKPFINCKPADKFLFFADAPCSGSGVISRYPEMLMFKSENDINALAQTQYMIVSKLIQTAQPGTVIIYSVCSITNSETFALIDKLLKNHKNISAAQPDCSLISKLNVPIKYFSSDKGLLIIPQKDIIDGFFIAKIIVNR